jgi:hypothetical protein
MQDTFLNLDLLRSFDLSRFSQQQPFPWFNFHQFLTSAGFEALYRTFPSLELFEQHRGIERIHGQRPHDRYYLAYEKSLYGAREGQGLIKKEDLPPTWQKFIDEIESCQPYHDFIERAFDARGYELRYAWHVGVEGSEVSPHCDGQSKLGTHIFYFNTAEDWNEEWGGSTLVLSGRKTRAMNPDFSDFTTATESQLIDNRSFLFKNTEQAWHGVRPLTCPPGHYRRLFNVIYEAATSDAEYSATVQTKPLSRIKSLAQRLLPTK